MKAFTYDDILMVPSYNHWESRKIVDISMKCKMGKLTLDVPLMTSNRVEKRSRVHILIHIFAT